MKVLLHVLTLACLATLGTAAPVRALAVTTAGTPLGGSTEKATQYILSEQRQWARLIRENGGSRFTSKPE